LASVYSSHIVSAIYRHHSVALLTSVTQTATLLNSALANGLHSKAFATYQSNMKITILNFEVAEVDTLELPAELVGAQIEALEGFIIGKGYSLGNIEWLQHE